MTCSMYGDGKEDPIRNKRFRVRFDWKAAGKSTIIRFLQEGTADDPAGKEGLRDPIKNPESWDLVCDRC